MLLFIPWIGLGTTAPTPSWNGKVVSWEANSYALSYEIRYKNSNDKNITEEEVTGTSKDLTGFVNEHGAGTYYFQVRAKRGDLSTGYSSSQEKTWCKIGVYPATFNRAGTAVHAGTDGGSVAGTVVSGDTQDAFGAPDEKGRIEGLFAEGDVLRLTATANDEHDFIEWYTYEEVGPGQWEQTAPKVNPLEFTVKLDIPDIQADFKKQVPVARLKLHFGNAHAALATSDKVKQALEKEGFSDVQANGSTVSMTIPTTYESEDPRSVISVENTLSEIVYGVTKGGMGAGERFPPMWGIGLNAPKDYTSYIDIRNERIELNNKQIEDGQEFHVLWSAPISKVGLSIEAPKCGTKVTAEYSNPQDPTEGYDFATITPRVSVVVTTDNAEVANESEVGEVAFWFDPEATGFDPFVGTIEGEKTYRALVGIQPAFGWYFSEGMEITVDGGTIVPMDGPAGPTGQLYIDVPAVHDWGEWTVTKPATVDEEGVETRVCKGDAEHKETRPIPKLIPSDDCTLAPIANQTYTGKAIAPGLTITDKEGNTLVAGTDYDVEPLKNNVNVGTVAVKVTLKGKYTGSLTGEFQIVPATITRASGVAKTFNGKAQTTTWTVKAGKLTVPKAGFTVSGYKANKNAGTATATITGTGNFTGSVTGKFKIRPKKVTAVSTKAKVAYTGKAIKPAMSVRAGGVAVPASGYTVKWTNNVKAGTATAKVTGKGNYAGSAKTTFRIVAPTVQYMCHIQTTGDEKSWEKNGRMSGTTGRCKRLEALCIKLSGGCPVSGGIRYKAKVQGKGWDDWRQDGELTGTKRQWKRLEIVRIELTGNMRQAYDVYYRVHVQHLGWLSWAKNGANAGTSGFKYRLEAIQVVLVPKGSKAPSASYKGVTQWVSRPFVKK